MKQIPPKSCNGLWFYKEDIFLHKEKLLTTFKVRLSNGINNGIQCTDKGLSTTCLHSCRTVTESQIYTITSMLFVQDNCMTDSAHISENSCRIKIHICKITSSKQTFPSIALEKKHAGQKPLSYTFEMLLLDFIFNMNILQPKQEEFQVNILCPVVKQILQTSCQQLKCVQIFWLWWQLNLGPSQ